MSDDMIVSDDPCPIGRAADVIGDRWTLLILRNATTGMSRFDEFRDELGISDNVLSIRLARLVEAGLLVKVPYRGERRTRHEYRLTRAGADLLPVLHAVAKWGHDHTRSAEREQEPMRVMHVTCGREMPFGEHCPHCGREAEREEITWLRPWRSPAPFQIAGPVA